MSKVLVIVDAQNDFISGPLGNLCAEFVRDRIKDRIKEAVKKEEAIIFTRDTHTLDYLNTAEGKKLPIEHCIQDTEGWQIDKKLIDCIPENYPYKIINKSTFGSIKLMDELFKFNKIEFCGFDTDICVISNALIAKAFYPDTDITVNEKFCNGSTFSGHLAALDVMNTCQINIIKEKIQ